MTIGLFYNPPNNVHCRQSNADFASCLGKMQNDDANGLKQAFYIRVPIFPSICQHPHFAGLWSVTSWLMHPELPLLLTQENFIYQVFMTFRGGQSKVQLQYFHHVGTCGAGGYIKKAPTLGQNGRHSLMTTFIIQCFVSADIKNTVSHEIFMRFILTLLSMVGLQCATLLLWSSSLTLFHDTILDAVLLLGQFVHIVSFMQVRHRGKIAVLP